MKKKFAELEYGRNLLDKIDALKQTMAKQGADRVLTELFDFKIVS
jgi:hypothetical protein